MAEQFEKVQYPIALQLVIDVLNDAEREMVGEDYLHFLESVRDTAGNRAKSVKKVLDSGKKWWHLW